MENPPTSFRGIQVDVEEPLQNVVDNFSLQGISISRASAHRLRRKQTSGARIDDRFECSARLKSNDAAQKDQLYLQLAQAGIASRRYRLAYPHRLTSHGFTEDLVARPSMIQAQIDRDTATSLLRSVRVELIFSELASNSSDLTRFFGEIASECLDALTTPQNANTSPTMLGLKKDWNNSSIRDFYSHLTAIRSAEARSMWVPYEVEVIEFFYQQQLILGHHLSRLDRLILEKFLLRTDERVIAQTVTDQTGLPYSTKNLIDHKNALVYGSPNNPSFSLQATNG